MHRISFSLSCLMLTLRPVASMRVYPHLSGGAGRLSSLGSAVLACADADAADDLDDCACSARVSASFSDAEDGKPLGERFDMQVRALQGEFSPTDVDKDHERGDNLLLEGLVGFPAEVALKVVTHPASSAEQEALLSKLNHACVEAVGVPPTRIQSTPRLGGKVASIGMSVLVSSPRSLTMLREHLRGLSGVRMVF
uniref:Uncharacterized protein n=1 Tax=Coccolithus braarudii TaxID=221442 RepID=A0A7S0Q8F0_9EUKA|mmetsp:Transcript_4837/g.10642  ORF Transcript_4837/g.10642 Transcript_4837/m.10642 type:complete len:196 (+) Transcript_4837:37-624(+)